MCHHTFWESRTRCGLHEGVGEASQDCDEEVFVVPRVDDDDIPLSDDPSHSTSVFRANVD